MTIGTSVAITVALVVAIGPATAAAQSADAEALFREAKKLMKKGDIAAACEKFEASERLEPTVGTELNLADCREKNGELATAWATFVKAAQTAKHTAGNDKRAAEAKRRADALEPKLVYLTIAIPEPARVDGLVVKRNDTVLDPALYDQAVPVDTGEYIISAGAPGHEDWKRTVKINKKNKTVEVPVLDESPTPRPKPEVSARRKHVAPPAPADDQPSRFTGTRKLAVVMAIAGVGAGAAGVVFGLKGQDLENQSEAICPTSRCSSAAAFDLNSRARTDGLVANIGMIGGGALVAGAVVLWFVGRPDRRDAVAFVPSIGPSGIALAGRF